MTTTTINGMITAAEADDRIRRAEARLEGALQTQHRSHQEALHELEMQRLDDLHTLRMEAHTRWHAERMRRLDLRLKVANVGLAIALLACFVVMAATITLRIAN